MKKAVFWILIIVLATGGYLYYSRQHTSAPATTGRQSAPPPVTVARVELKDMPQEYSTFSHVEASASVDIFPRVDGQLTSIRVKDGQYVNKGDLLFTLDDRALQAELAQAKASLEQNQASLRGARTTLDRKKAMFARKAASEQDVEDAQTSYNTLLASIDANKAAISLAQTQLSYTQISSPLTGRIGNISVDVGSIIKTSATTALVSVRQLEPVKVLFSLPERYFNQLQAELNSKGSEVPVKLVLTTSQGEQSFTGHVAYIDNNIDTASGTLPVYAEFDNPDHKLWPGQFAQVTLQLGVDKGATVVPETAIKDGPESPYVFILNADGTVTQRNVTLDRISYGQAVVSEGLKDGESVITTGQQNLRNGIRVKVETPDSDSHATADSAHKQSSHTSSSKQAEAPAA
ncbi:hypothetical protein C4K68_05460 [Pokkaliibacter plantistimulans]|uniref:Uncharacterized protein n=1 Tax=Proteobacteria bacterium 228 TaxID=2083153 RepID=A0A2S5KUF6_9PROT|nr:efflux RND transporter periplasmic adaptor subunit [Pokkaliibacter plantistimulans]PPC78494.1 hypothetical protein C4K68_05460 [Pokkaliibacter plantistimulans]